MPEFGEIDKLSQVTEKDHNDLDARDAADVHPHSSLESIDAENHHTLPIRATMWHNESVVTVGNVLTHIVSSSQRYNIITYQNPSANGDTFKNDFTLKAGNYTLYILGAIYSACGKQDIYIDDVKQTVTPLDWYSAPTVYNSILTSLITVIGNGVHTMKSIINGKNASSTGYDLYPTKFWVK